jgi:cytochrome d ubiquinol oxidase subunit I
MDFDPVFFSRLQFAWVIGWHILLPGLAAYIALLEGLNFVTGRQVYLRVSMFWIKVFSISFGMGVVTGIIMPFQFGMNWSRYSDATANILSPLFAYEGLTAFFLEAAFLGVLLFGRKLVPQWAHFVAALMVSLGTLLSSFWILAANSWMQTPAGYEIIDGRFFPTDCCKSSSIRHFRRGSRTRWWHFLSPQVSSWWASEPICCGVRSPPKKVGLCCQ